MTVLVGAETFILALVSLLVVGLLRSHAEILRRLEAPGAPQRRPRSGGEELDPRIAPPDDAALGEEAHEIAASTIAGDARKVAFPPGGPGTLIAFLTSGCAVCGHFWSAFASGQTTLPSGTNLVIVTKDSTHESPSKLNKLAPRGVPVLMSSDAWDAYDVPMAPYFVYVDGPSGRIHGQGSAGNWEQLRSLFTDYLFDRETAATRSADTPETAGGHKARLDRVEASLRDAQIEPDDPSLYEPPQLPEDAAATEEFLRLVEVRGGARSGDA
jgi:hypothetical protein